MEPIIRPATTEDQNALSGLLNFHGAIHRHLDWKPTMDWLGKQPFWLMESDHHLLGALAIPPDPPHVAWVRLFVTRLGVAAVMCGMSCFQPPTNIYPPVQQE